jgi:DedD protein
MMERALKERIIGAIVLVIFVVLVVPIFLDGPPSDGEIVSERVLLPGQEDQDTKTVVLDRERSEPNPAASNPQTARTTKPVTLPAPEAKKPDARPVVDEPAESASARVEPQSDPPSQQTAPEPAVSSTGMWAVQLGSFSSKDNAEKMAADLRKQGYGAFLSQLQTSAGPMHRVRIGPQKDRAGAEAMAARLLKVNHKGQVVPHP